MLTMAALGMVTCLCAAYDGGLGIEHKPDKGVSFHGDGYHDWLTPWDGHTTKPLHPDYSKKIYYYTYPYCYYVPYYYYYPYTWHYTPLSYDQWWDPWWATNVYGIGKVTYAFNSGWGYHSGLTFGDI
jgi:hypothetical protein